MSGREHDFVIPGFVRSGFCFIHFTVTLGGPKNIVRYIPRISLTRGALNRSSTVFIHDFILSPIYRVAKKLISSRKRKKERFTNNKITLLSTNHISINAKRYERRMMVRIRRLKPAKVDSVLMFSGREFQVLQAKYLKE